MAKSRPGSKHQPRRRSLRRAAGARGRSTPSPSRDSDSHPHPEYQVVVEAASDAVITIDERSTILSANPAIERIFGYAPDELMGRKLTVLMPERLRRRHVRALRRYLTTGRRHLAWDRVEFTGRHKTGKEVPLEISFATFERGGRRFFTGFVRDASEQEWLRRRIRAQYAVTRVIAESDSLAEAGPKLLQVIGELAGWDLGELWQVDAEAATLCCRSIWHAPALHPSEFEAVAGTTTFAPGTGVPGRVWAVGEPAWMSDLTADAGFTRDSVAARAGLRAGCAFPIRRAGRVTGVLAFFSREARAPEPVLLEMLNALGDQIGEFLARLEAEEAIRIREMRFRALVEHSSDAVAIIDGDGIIQYASQSTARVLGYEPQELVGRNGFDLVHPDDRRYTEALLAECLRSPGVSVQAEYRFRHKDGSWRFLEGVGVNRLDDPTVQGFVANFRDATERKRLEDSSRLAVEAAPNAMIMVDRRGKITLLNQQAERLFGYTRVELMGQTIETLIPERFRPKHPGYRGDFLAHPKTRAMGAGRDLFGLRKDETEVPIEIGLSPIDTPEGVLTLASIIDITERKRAQEQQQLINRQLETLIHVISHDLKEPLRTIESFSMILNEQYAEHLDEKGRDFGQRIVKASARLRLLLDDIVTVSRARRVEPGKEQVEGRIVVAEALAQLKARIEETKAKIHIAPALPLLRAEVTWAVQAVYNVVSNALKFTREPQPAEVEIAPYGLDQRDPRGVGLIIRDRGPGVAPEHRERIFELFQRAVGSEVEGTGAGLAIVKEIATRHGGDAWVQPREGGGSEFILTFGGARHGPRGDEPAAQQALTHSPG